MDLFDWTDSRALEVFNALKLVDEEENEAGNKVDMDLRRQFLLNSLFGVLLAVKDNSNLENPRSGCQEKSSPPATLLASSICKSIEDKLVALELVEFNVALVAPEVNQLDNILKVDSDGCFIKYSSSRR